MKAVFVYWYIFLVLLVVSTMASGQDTRAQQLNKVHGKAPFLTLVPSKIYHRKQDQLPFINSPIAAPPKEVYKGPLFKLRHDYPVSLAPKTNYPWKKVTNNGKITIKNAGQYVLALKQYVAKDMRKLLYNYKDWNSAKEKWWESIWLGMEREPVRGFYVGSGFPAGTLTHQKYGLTTYVLTMYDERAAKTLGAIWGRSYKRAMNPIFNKGTTQFAEGSVIIKFSFVTSCGNDWPPMQKAAMWKIYAPLNSSNGSGHNPKSRCKNTGSKGTSKIPAMTNVYFMQFDIIVKDSVAAPETTWVFTTLVYDKNAKGKDAWDRMIPLGATWGNNSKIINIRSSALTPPVQVNLKLTENWINPSAPKYSTATLGWDGRLSGPNDGAVVNPAWTGVRYKHNGIASAGCLGCHSSAQYPMTSFLLPNVSYPPTTRPAPLSSDSSTAALILPVPGSALWMKWFQSRKGYTPMGPNTASGKKPVALDYDMVTAFKAIPQWLAAVNASLKSSRGDKSKYKKSGR